MSTTTNTPAGPSECAAQAQQRHPAGEAGPYPPEVAAQYRAVRDRRAALTAAVRGILAEQPTPRLVRTVAHRIANDVHLIAEDIVRAMESEDRT